MVFDMASPCLTKLSCEFRSISRTYSVLREMQYEQLISMIWEEKKNKKHNDKAKEKGRAGSIDVKSMSDLYCKDLSVAQGLECHI